ncbi:alpha/beta fold hydrolase [Dactylosporangium salmoneum]|uniref:Alpha/beta hydrolase n=1 Tax=Dactylosporangium salmoneum TaxID=53361 RepID=A0ABP5T4L3_9ACTN
MSLHVEVSGAGPALLLIPGGAGDAATYGRIVGPLARARTVIAYDRRGFSRSPIAAQERAAKYDHDVEDAARLIDEHAGGRADVFGSSSGAIVALGLAARHPGKVGRVIAHEPPLTAFVPDAVAFDDVVEAFEREGTEAAMRRFAGITGLAHREPPIDQLPPAVVEVIRRIGANLPFWIEWELRQYTRIRPDLGALPDGVVVAVGAGSGEQFPARAARGLARRLGREAVEMPGDHEGYVAVPDEFAARTEPLLRPAT